MPFALRGCRSTRRSRAKDVAKSAYFPQVQNDTMLVHLSDTQLVEIPAGGLGVVGITPVPPQTLILNQGGREYVSPTEPASFNPSLSSSK